MGRIAHTGTAFFVALALAVGAPQAWAGAVGSEFPVNSTTASIQTEPAVASLSNGGFVVVWTSIQDGGGFGIYGQRYGATGTRVGSEFPINTTTADDQYLPSVAGLNNGGFVVTWTSFSGQDGAEGGIYGRLFDNTGAAVGSEFGVNVTTFGDQRDSSVASLSDGGFVVTWTYSFSVIFGQRFDAQAVPVGPEFTVNSYAGKQTESSVAGLSGGGFVVTWSSFRQKGCCNDIYGQRYKSDGTRLGSEFKVNTYSKGEQFEPSVASLSNGGFVVTWASNNSDGSGYGIFAQRYNANGKLSGSEFRVNTYKTGEQSGPSIAGLVDGFIITWHSNNQDGSAYGIYGQRFSASGKKSGMEFRINTTAEFGQTFPSVAGIGNGGYVVTWNSDVQDGSAGGIYGQRYSP